MHEWEKLNKKPQPPRKGVKPVNKRNVTEECEYGDVVVFPLGPPNVNVGGDLQVAPSDRGVVSMFIMGSPFVRFELKGRRWSEPLNVEHNQPIQRIKGYR